MARKHSDGSTPRRWRLRWLLVLAFVLIVSFGIGFARFLGNLPLPASESTAKADAIVALTGEGGRLAPAVTLLENGGCPRAPLTRAETPILQEYLEKAP